MKKLTINIVRGFLCLIVKSFLISMFIAILLILILTARNASAQEKGQSGGIQVGQYIPEMVMNKKFSSLDLDASLKAGKPLLSQSGIRLSDFKGKLLLIDFWATWCGSCLAKFPKLKIIQDKYKGELDILIINNEPLQKTFSTLSRRNKERNESFNALVLDSTFEALFPHLSIPHYVWLGKNGHVLAITGSEEIEEKNILAMVNEQNVKMVSKIDISAKTPLFTTPQFPIDNFLKFSLLSRGLYSGLPSTNFSRMDKTGKIKRGNSFTNLPMVQIHRAIATEIFRKTGPGIIEPNIIYDGVHNLDYTKELFNYEFDIPVDQAAELYPLMLEDLNTSSPYVAKILPRRIKCLGLFSVPDFKRSSTTAGKQYFQKTESGADGKSQQFIMYNKPSVLVSYLKLVKSLEMPVVDETSGIELIEASFNMKGTLESINAELKHSGLYLKVIEKEINVLSVNDRVL